MSLGVNTSNISADVVLTCCSLCLSSYQKLTGEVGIMSKSTQPLLMPCGNPSDLSGSTMQSHFRAELFFLFISSPQTSSLSPPLVVRVDRRDECKHTFDAEFNIAKTKKQKILYLCHIS